MLGSTEVRTTYKKMAKVLLHLHRKFPKQVVLLFSANVYRAIESPAGLLSQVANEVAKIEASEEREEIISSAQLLAGLRFDVNLVRSLFGGGFMRESVVFQEILQEGRGQGKHEEALAMIYRLLPRRIGTVAPELQQRLLRLSVFQLEDLGEALLDFNGPEDLIAWFDGINE